MKCPHVQASLPAVPTDERKEEIEAIPGVRVQGRVVRVPYHAVPFAEANLARLGIVVTNPRMVGEVPASVPWGRIDQYLNDRGEVRPEFLGEYPLPFQREGLSFCVPRTGSLLHHPTGAGKTYQEILWSLCAPGPVLVATKGSVRQQYARAVEKYTGLAPFVLKPKSLVRKKDRWKSLPEYGEFCRDTGKRPFVIVSLDGLETQQTELRMSGFGSLVLDEVHRIKSWKRWNNVPIPAPADRDDAMEAMIEEAKANGAFVKEDRRVPGRPPRYTLVKPAENRAKAAFLVAQSIPRRLCASATLIEDRVRDLYAPSTYAEPDAWGSWSVWSSRYTDPTASAYNPRARITTGLSNGDELVSRLAWIMHSVPAEVTRAQLPDMRRETLYVELADQAIIPKAQAAIFHKELQAATTSGARMEVQIAIGSARCLPAAVERMVDHLEAGEKVCVLTVRRWLVKEVAAQVAKALGKKSTIPILVADGTATQRDAMAMEYASTAGAAFLVGTGDALGTGTDNLQCTQAAFFLGVPYSPGVLEQWEGRFPRLGQLLPLLVYYVVGESTALEFFAEKVVSKLPAMEYVASSGALANVSGYLTGIGSPEDMAAGILAKLAQVPEDAENESWWGS